MMDDAEVSVEVVEERQSWPPRRRRTNKLLVVMVLLPVAVVASTGAYIWKLNRDRAAALSDLESLRGENRSLSDALELHRSSAAELDTKLTACETEQSEAVERLSSLDGALAQCEDVVSSGQEEFKRFTATFQRMIDTGKLEVEFRRGQMVVKLPAAILFPSGSAELSDSGREALGEVASILVTMRDRRFTVGGHTDNVPVSNEDFESNWELSTARAVAVTKMLVSEGVRPANLRAAGYAEFAPVASNRTRRGRSLNRRIELILEPDLRPALKQVGRP
jgi:chemotaxis protein MotB